jgi:ATP-binding protein involved in chromosome partitioning
VVDNGTTSAPQPTSRPTASDGSAGADGIEARVRAALATVDDPEIMKPITELGMVDRVEVSDGVAHIRVLLTVQGCPMRERLTTDVTAAVSALPEITRVDLELGVMNDAQRTALRTMLRGDNPPNEIPFAQPGSRTRVYAVASGKGGVGKSSVTVNLAVALAQRGLEVGVLDADIYGFSVPRMLGVTGRPTQVEKMILPPQAHGVKVISIGMFTADNAAVVWRGPMLHRALQQFLSDVFWGDLDVLLMDLPPGTGDIAISLAQLVPSAELLVVTTPQLAAREVAERAGSVAVQTHQQIVGVVENMSWLELPDGTRMELFGSGGGQAVADSLARITGARVDLLSQVPMDVALREGGDSGQPIVVSHPESPAALALGQVADRLSRRQSSLVGRSLGLAPAGR